MTVAPNPLLFFTTPWFWYSFISWTLAQVFIMTVGFIMSGQFVFVFLLS